MVPAAIDSMMFFLHTWMMMVNATAMNCDRASGDNKTRQCAMPPCRLSKLKSEDNKSPRGRRPTLATPCPNT